MKFIVILNEKAGIKASGSDAAVHTVLRQKFSDAGIEADVQSMAPDMIDHALKRAIAARPDAVIIGGGDGTVRSAAHALVGSGIPLGVLPLGTLNHFAKDLKIPPEIEAAAAALATGIVREVDVGEVNGHLFINNCSIGSYAEAVRRRDALRRERPQGKWWAMMRASFETFRRFRRVRLRITIAENYPRAVHTPVVVIANNRYSGHVLDKCMRARLDEGHLWLYTAHVKRHLAAVRMMWQSLVRRLDAADALAAEPATEFVIESDSGGLPVAADGEVVNLKSPLRFRIRPRALKVLAPREAENPSS